MIRVKRGFAALLIASALSFGVALAPVSAAPPAARVVITPTKSVTPGAFCTPGGAVGKTVNGVLMKCTTTAADSRNRWRVK